MCPKDADGIRNIVDPDPVGAVWLEEQSDLGLNCLPRPACPKT